MNSSKDNTQQNIPSDVRPAMSRIWMKDSSGYPSVTITFLFVSFWITTLAYILSIVSKIGSIEIRPFDVGACGAYFGIIFSAYIARRYTDARWGNPNVTSSNSNPSSSVIPTQPVNSQSDVNILQG